jgi:hypothetical protein
MRVDPRTRRDVFAKVFGQILGHRHGQHPRQQIG